MNIREYKGKYYVDGVFRFDTHSLALDFCLSQQKATKFDAKIGNKAIYLQKTIIENKRLNRLL